jgi:ATP-dependent helicase/nuclease subunit B
MRYGDIAVVVRDLDAYRGILDAALERHKIPYFFSERTDLAAKPIFRLILSALCCVSRNYRQSDVIALLKTGLCGVSLRDAAMFEEYVETWHIGGRRFLDELWSMNPDGLTTERSPRADEILDAANRVRRQLMAPLSALSASLCASHRLEDRSRALYEYLVALELPSVLASRAKEELALGQVREASESLRLYATLLDTLTTLCKLLPDCELSIEDFIAALTLVLGNADLGSVPTTQDSVVIGSADTLRVENVRASILLGLCEGEFPRAVSDDGILTEADKEALEEYGVILQSRERMRSSEELFYVYRAISKPTEFLSLLTHAKQTDGSARTPSLAFNRVAFLLDKKAEVIDFTEIRRARELPTSEDLQKPLQAPPTEERVALRLSQSKIQAFVLCPYRYFSTYTLKLRERKDSQPSYADDGTFLHYVFEHFLRASLTDEGKLQLPSPEDVEPMADAIIADYIGEVCPFPAESMDNRLLHLYARLRRLALKMLCEILGEIRTGLFVPTYFEKGIGTRDEGSLPPVRLTLANGSSVLLSGKIDRVDIYENDGKLYFRVVDYKSGKHTFSLDEVRSGMDIQLILYLFALSGAMPHSTPAGAQYLFASNEKGTTEIKRSGLLLDEDAIDAAVNGQGEATYTKGLTKQTLEEMKQLQSEMQDAVRSVAERILSGEAQKTPSEKACAFCPVRADCNRAYHR